MAKFIVGTKDGMTQVFDERGVCRAATILRVDPATVSQVKTPETDGYHAVQLASGSQKEHRVSKAERGHFKGAVAVAREYRPKRGQEAAIADLAPGATLNVSMFEAGEKVTVSATSKGKGFQGVIKRHGFSGGNRTHGNKHHERAPGSIGATGVARVLKGTRMAGRMGGETITVKNLQVLQVNPEENLLLVAGAIPGRRGSLVAVHGTA